MDDDGDSSESTSGTRSAWDEKEEMYPDKGFVLAEIDMLKPPGEALTRLNHSLLLSDITIPSATELTDYVVYDADGHDYGQRSLQKVRDRVESREVEELIDDVRCGTIRERRLGLFGLVELAEESPEACLDAVPVLTSALQATEPDIRAASLAVFVPLANAHPEHVTPAVNEIIPLLDSGTELGTVQNAVRVVAAVAAHEPKAVMDATPVLTALLQEDAPVENMALTALRRIATAYPDAVVPAASELIEYIKHNGGSQRISAIAVLGAISKTYPNIAESTIPIVSELLEADDKKLRANAAGLLADLAEEYPEEVRPVVPRAIELLDDEDKKARYNATSILARIAKEYPTDVEPAIDPLVGMLDDEFPRSRANACWALGYLQAEQALNALEELEQADSSEKVQNAAGFAINEITTGS